tara:strand:- start:387 stop:668 length:282 start_codon:yes stop_codon:yes gene_type:complete
MRNYNLKSYLNFNTEKEFIPCLNEYHQELAVIDFDEVYEGYKIIFTKVESKLTKGLVYYEASSNEFSSPNVYESIEQMCEFYNEWKDELINAK